MKCAIKRIMEDGMTIRQVVSHFSVPKNFLGDRIKLEVITVTSQMGKFQRTGV